MCRPVLNFSELQNIVSKLEKLPCSIQHKDELMVSTSVTSVVHRLDCTEYAYASTHTHARTHAHTHRRDLFSFVMYM